MTSNADCAAKVVFRRSGVRLQGVPGGVILYDAVRDRVFDGNPAAREILAMVAEGFEVSEIVRSVAERFAIPLVRAKADVSEFLSLLRQLGLVEP